MTTLSLEEMKANRRKWVEALRSGKYEQGRGNLLSEGRFCCLGVLACVAGYKDNEIDGHTTLARFDLARKFVGLSGALGGYDEDEEHRNYLADLNDDGKPFADIAAIIESEPPGLFIDTTPSTATREQP